MKLSWQNSLQNIMRKALRPLVSLLIKNSVSYQMFCQLIKELYVDVAAHEYGKGGRPTNTTRISLLTGIDRKDVKRIKDVTLDQTAVHADPPRSRSGALGRVLSAWHQDSEFADDGRPRPLKLTGGFVDLCKRYGGDITRTAILKELQRVNAVENRPDDRVVAVTRYYMPAQADHEAIARSFDVYRDLGETLVYNLYRNSSLPSRFEGRATSPNVPVSRVDHFRNFVENRGQSFLEEVDAQLANYEQHADKGEHKIRLGVGLYLIAQDKELNK